MATDWACAIIPFFIVAGLQMSRRRKISVIAILGLGVSASIATCIRMPYLKYYDTSENVLQNSGQGIRLDSINGRKGTFHASAQRVPSRARDHETDDDNSSSKGIIRKTEIRVSSSRFNS
ncbi:hypothetical protein LB505_011183 [Fusarium chuoi]|nr:hypothetical protein LB505_011183 [Fusarium chuoi]